MFKMPSLKTKMQYTELYIVHKCLDLKDTVFSTYYTHLTRTPLAPDQIEKLKSCLKGLKKNIDCFKCVFCFLLHEGALKHSHHSI